MNDRLHQRGTLTNRLAHLHDQLLEKVPDIDRIACALYDKKSDTLKTFINSTRTGHAIERYEYLLGESQALHDLARSGDFRVLDEIGSAITSNTQHSAWLLEQGYRSSFTVPIYDNEDLLGFIFFDSTRPAAFTPAVQRDLVLYTTLISMAIANERSTVQMVLESARVARELTEMRDFETGAHLERMAHYARLIAQGVAEEYGLSDEFIEHIYLYAPLHDIGKIAIPDRILLKEGPLDPDERALMNTHVDRGVEIIDRIISRGVPSRLPDSSILRNIVQSHHELLDGSGYPQGLRGTDIPVEARIVTVADIFDALTATRPYKPAWPAEAALAELLRMADNGKLDRACVRALQDAPARAQAIMTDYAD